MCSPTCLYCACRGRDCVYACVLLRVRACFDLRFGECACVRACVSAPLCLFTCKRITVGEDVRMRVRVMSALSKTPPNIKPPGFIFESTFPGPQGEALYLGGGALLPIIPPPRISEPGGMGVGPVLRRRPQALPHPHRLLAPHPHAGCLRMPLVQQPLPCFSSLSEFCSQLCFYAILEF